jgi:hypothetical protein
MMTAEVRRATDCGASACPEAWENASHVRGRGAAIHPFKPLFVVGAVSTDVRSGQATMCYLPGIETPERECWYINLGAVDRSFFTTDAMVRAANF